MIIRSSVEAPGPRKRIFYLLNKALHFEFFSKLSQSKVKWSFFAPVKKGEPVLDSTQSQDTHLLWK